ncbi:MAG: cytochrome c oxidase accessory protein FixG [Oleispira sp.]|jgi:cytochrome c oxidase accessory protein FixG
MSKLIATSQAPQSSGLKQFISFFKANSLPHRVRLMPGRYLTLRRIISWPLLLLCFLTPWLMWNDLPLVHFDLVAKQFRLGSVIFWPEDLLVLTWAMLAGAFGLFLVAMASGRLWCGFSCPQTVWTFLFIRLEELIEGSRHKRLKMDRLPWNTEKVLRKLTKHISWISLSVWTGITFIAYFYPLEAMAHDLSQSDLAGMGLFWILFFAVMTYLNAGFLREQVCTHMCPYSRFQSVMSDRFTLEVQYDEPRNDCIDCQVCVHVCPAEIDIRDGMQLSCIACGACVDACDSIMEQINKPKGLIAFRPGKATIKEALNLKQRPRLVGYVVAFLLSVFLIGLEVTSRDSIQISLERDRNSLYRISVNDEIENSFSLKLHNKTQQDMAVQLMIADNLPGFKLSQQNFNIPAGERQQFPLLISLAQPSSGASTPPVLSYKTAIHLQVISPKFEQLVNEIDTSFFMPSIR